eukprot:1174341-Prorocentrum_minimum.AAC.3
MSPNTDTRLHSPNNYVDLEAHLEAYDLEDDYQQRPHCAVEDPRVGARNAERCLLQEPGGEHHHDANAHHTMLTGFDVSVASARREHPQGHQAGRLHRDEHKYPHSLRDDVRV